MPASQSPPSTDRAEQACMQCKTRKRRCDKGLPQCFACSNSKKGLKCDYSWYKLDQNNNGTGVWPYGSSSETNQHNVQTVDFPTLLFLDPRVLQYGQVDIPRPAILVPPIITQLVGDLDEVRSTASRFYETVHTWIPFISKRRFYDHHLQPSNQSRSELALLFLCIKLVTNPPPESPQSPQTRAYYAAKHFHVELENSGIFSVQILQAGILLSIYELGHAIYPAAFLSIGACARSACALGINSNSTLTRKALTLVEVEERRRIWWAIVVLDRFVSIGCPGRPFATEDPKADDLLPASCAAWDRGMVDPDDAFTLSSPMTSHMSRFALVCQAARLLGQVLKHVSSDIIDQELQDEEAVQLDRTIRAMVSASESLDSPQYDSISVGYSSLMALHEPRMTSSNGFPILTYRFQRARDTLEALSHRITEHLPEEVIHLASHLDRVAPWGIFLAYSTAVTYMRLGRETASPESLEALQLLKQTLGTLDRKRKAAGAYLQVLEAREVMGVV